MDVYAVTVKTNIYIIADSVEEAEEITRTELDGLLDLPLSTPNFAFDAYRTPNQSDNFKKKAYNYKR